MAKLTSKCPYCLKDLELVSSTPFGTQFYNIYKCGHAFVAESSVITKAGSYEFKSLNEKKEAFDYQKEGIDFIFKAGFNVLISDQMGLGKTIQSILALRNAYDKFKSCLIVVKSSTIWQWMEEYKEWCDASPLGLFMIQNSKSFIPPSFHTYLISMDALAREGMIDKLIALGIDLCIVDEMHSFKNPSSKRSQALMQFFKQINSVELVHDIPLVCGICKHSWTETVKVMNEDLKTFTTHNTFCPDCNAQVWGRTFKERIDVPEKKCKTILLSGTPIVNRADEYFVPLNILAPDIFSSLDRFRKNWLEQDHKGKWTRVKSWKIEEFREVISKFVIRRERKDVLKDLPAFQRVYTTIGMDNEELKKMYNKEIQKLLDKDAENGTLTYQDISENIASMRRITALAKVDFVVDQVMAFLDSTEDEKITLGIHHRDVRLTLMEVLKKFEPLSLSGEDSPEKKNWIVHEFQKPHRRVLIANTLAGGVGLNLQFCNNAMVLERQWSSAYEEQFEGRFNRPGQTRPVSCDYILIKGTIDEYFHNLVEEKRAIFGETVENNWSPISISDSARKFIDWSAANKL